MERKLSITVSLGELVFGLIGAGIAFGWCQEWLWSAAGFAAAAALVGWAMWSDARNPAGSGAQTGDYFLLAEEMPARAPRAVQVYPAPTLKGDGFCEGWAEI